LVKPTKNFYAAKKLYENIFGFISVIFAKTLKLQYQ